MSRIAPEPRAAAPAIKPEEPYLRDGLRIFGLLATVCLIFVRFGMVHQMAAYIFGARLFLQYILGLPALAAMVATGGLNRAFRGRTALYWTAYAFWILLASPFSFWRSASLNGALVYIRAEYILLPLIAGLILTWRECGLALRAIAWGGVVLVAAAKVLQDPSSNERLTLVTGTVSNANDYACVLLLALPFILWLALTSKWVIVRLGMFVALGFGIYATLSTASRGALIAMLAEAVVFLLLATWRQRAVFLALGSITLVSLTAALPADVKERLTAIAQDPDQSSVIAAGAAESSEVRKYIFFKSIEHTIRNPIFGVGPGQMANYEGTRTKAIDRPGVWHNAHNTPLQAASECGIPAAMFFMAGTVSTFLLLRSTYRKAHATPGCADIRTAAFCIMVGMTGFFVATLFLNFAYYFYQPALGGLALAVFSAAEREFERRGAAATPAPASTGASGLWKRGASAGVIA